MDLTTGEDDDDIALLKQSNLYIQDLDAAFEHVEHVKNERELDKIICRIEPFQEDPQLLDAHLGRFIPLLSRKFLAHLRQPQSRANLSKIIYTFCRVRGEKVITSLLANEPKWIEPLLTAFQAEHRPNRPWEESYVLLLWLSLLMLTPFDLATISSLDAKDVEVELELPLDMPSVAVQSLRIGMEHLKTATIEHKAASRLLVRICIRDDMLKLDLLSLLASWAMNTFRAAAQAFELHPCLGILTFLCGLVMSAEQKQLEPHIPSILLLTQKLQGSEDFAVVRSSAIGRKLTLKLQRNLVTSCLQRYHGYIDPTEILEHVIETSITSLADLDTSVRMAAAKAISSIALKLDHDMAHEIVDAVNSAFDEDLASGQMHIYRTMDAAKWHGVVLTLSHFLHRRAVSVAQIPSILRSILLALDFEQRTISGKSTGANVRDAANYGLWSLARRYTTKELDTVNVKLITTSQTPLASHSVQYVAIKLLQSSCLDPDGNVRRGSSAALQELIGRHPNTIIEGIKLVQIVDYQSVGLRSRAATKILSEAAKLDLIYHKALLNTLLGWRGIACANLSSRSDASVAIGMLFVSIFRACPTAQRVKEAQESISALRLRMRELPSHDHEQRHGIILALSWIISAMIYATLNFGDDSNTLALSHQVFEAVYKPGEILTADEFHFIVQEDRNLRSARMDMVLAATLRLIGQVGAYITHTSNSAHRFDRDTYGIIVWKCLAKYEDIVTNEIAAVRVSIGAFDQSGRQEVVRTWLDDLSKSNAITGGGTQSSRFLAFGSIFAELPVDSQDIRGEILKLFHITYIQGNDVETKIVILRALGLLLSGLVDNPPESQIEETKTHLVCIKCMILLALSDYTISERGDVGSLLRLAGLSALQQAWDQAWFNAYSSDERFVQASVPLYECGDLGHSLNSHLSATVLRLSLEKLDKVRLTALHCLMIKYKASRGAKLLNLEASIHALLTQEAPLPILKPLEYDVSSSQYFMHHLQCIIDASLPLHFQLRIFEGFALTAGGAGSGASSTLLNARRSLQKFLESKPASETQGSGNALAFLKISKLAIEVNTRSGDDLRLISILEVIAFVLDSGLIQTLRVTEWSWLSFLSTIQKSHFKSRNVLKLQLCLDLYRGLASIPDIADAIMRKMMTMLLHPFGVIRITTAEALITLGNFGVESVLDLLGKADWSLPARDLKALVNDINIRLKAA